MARGLPGFAGQYMAARKALQNFEMVAGPVNATTGAGSVTMARTCWALIFALGPGASGGQGSNGGGGGGGAALYKRVLLIRGQTLAWSVGTPGAASVSGDGNDATDTTVTLPSGQVLRAGGGKKGLSAGGAGAAGVATGGDVNRNGGIGGLGSLSGAGPSGSAGLGGGAGGALSGDQAGGGGGAGFSDYPVAFAGGAGGSVIGGGTASPGADYGGGGSAGSSATGAGGKGLVAIVFVRAF